MILLLAACSGTGSGVAAWVATYAAAQVVADEDLGEALEACAGIPDAGLRHGCTLQAIDRAGRQQGGIDHWCPTLSEPTTQAECWFRAAEDDLWRLDGARAIAFCERSGPFIADCAKHLWMRSQDTLMETEPRLVQAWPAALVLHDRWAEPLRQLAPSYSEEYWARFYSKQLAAPGPLDLPGCDALPQQGRPTCLARTMGAWEERMAAALHDPGTQAALCGLPTPTSRDSAAWVGAFPDPRLDVRVQALAIATCPAPAELR